MGKNSNGRWKRVNGRKYYIVANSGVLFQKVKIRDGKWEYTDNTIASSTTLSFRGMGLEEQIAKTLSRQIEKEERRQQKKENIREKIDRASRKVDEIYDDDW